MDNVKFYQKNAFMWVMLFLFFPVGLYLLFKHTSYSKRTKAIILGGFIALFALAGVSGPKESSTVVSPKITQSEMSKAISKSTEIIPEKANAVEDVLKQCGITSVEKISHDDKLDNSYATGGKGFRVVANNNEVENLIVYLSKDGQVDAVRWAAQNLYKDGAVVAKISDYHMTLEEKSRFQYSCEETIKKLLKAPKTADFPSITEWTFVKDKDKITIQSYVDAQNSFGAMIRSKFEFIIAPDGTIQSLVFDGKKYK